MDSFWYALWFFLPAGAANVAPILVVRLPFLKQWGASLDGGRSFRGKRLLGSSKTWRGLVCGTIVAGLVFMLQQSFAGHLGSFSVYLRSVRYDDLPLVLGVLMGCGALVGDAAESFFKRQAGVAPGKSWFPFDQLDYILGGCLFTVPIVVLSFQTYIWVFVLWFMIHLVSSYIGHLLELKKTPI